MGRFLWRATVMTHRYLGVAVGLLMLMWFVSGIVMMYVPYPNLTDKDRLSALSPIPWQACCSFEAQSLAGDLPVRTVEIHNMAGDPVMGLVAQGRPPRLSSLGSTGPIFEVDEAKARAIAFAAAASIVGGGTRAVAEELIARDQWTVGDSGEGSPFYHFIFDDPARTHIYVSSTTGNIVLWTTATQRFWNWLGAIPHWLYFTQLRSNGPLWAQVVIWTSILGGFLTFLGLYLGIAQFRQGKSGRVSPYRGWFYWHHVAGLVFGVLTLTWVVSGTLSMNPWGFLDARGGGNERARIVGDPIAWRTIRDSLSALKGNSPQGVVRLRSAPLDGRLFWLAARNDGSITRLDAGGSPAPLGMTDLQLAGERLAQATPVRSKEMITTGDDYYFDFSVAERDDAPPFPVYRIVMNDAGQTRYYLDPRTGQLLRRVDANGRGQRWLFSGFHRLDFTAWLRARPMWDAIMFVLLLGGLAVTGTGTYLAVLRIKRDLTFKRQVHAEPVRET